MRRSLMPGGTFGVVVAVCVSTSCAEDSTTLAPPILGFPGSVSSGAGPTAIPYENGGSFEMTVSMYVKGLRDPLPARIRIRSELAMEGDVVETRVLLTRVRQGDDQFAATAMLVWPAGGPVRITVAAAGMETEQPVRIGLPGTVVLLPPADLRLPAPREVLTVVIGTQVDGRPTNGVPVAFAAIPTTDLAPVNTVSSDGGFAVTNVIVPPDAAGLVVTAISGNRRITVPFRR